MRAVLLALALVAACCGNLSVAQHAVVAVVNDHGITDYDIDQRIKFMDFIGERNPAKQARKAVLADIINDYIKVDEAKNAKVNPTEKELNDRLTGVAESMKTDAAGLKGKLDAAGIGVDTMRLFFAAQLSFSRLLQAKYREKLQVDPSAVDKKLSSIKAEILGKVKQAEADPRRKPIQVLQLQEINFPAEGDDPQLLQARGAEAAQVALKVKSCNNLKAATAGIFNVQIGKMIQADGSKLPPPLQAQLKKGGIGRAIGPMRYPQGVQLLVYCGGKTITPPPINYQLPTRQQVENVAMNEQYAALEAKYIAIMRKTAIIEYKEPSYAP